MIKQRRAIGGGGITRMCKHKYDFIVLKDLLLVLLAATSMISMQLLKQKKEEEVFFILSINFKL